MRHIFSIIILYLLATFPVVAQPKHEIRASWLTTLGGMDWPRQKATNALGIEKQKQELCDILDRLKAAHFNTVIFQTRLRGDLIYPSAIETFPEALTGKTGRNPGYDPLAFAIEECHKRGMETPCMDCHHSCRQQPTNQIAWQAFHCTEKQENMQTTSRSLVSGSRPS